jgi:hypothetical protein
VIPHPSPTKEPITSLMIGEQSAGKRLRPFGSVAAYEDAQRDIDRWFHAEWLKLLADKAAKEREIERKFWNGEYR